MSKKNFIPDLPKNNQKQKNILSSIKNEKKINNFSEDEILFTFKDFKMESLRIKGKFNNFYKDADHYILQLTTLLSETLPLISKEPLKELLLDKKSKYFRFHKIEKNLGLIKKILKKYDFTDEYINSIIEGESLYQIILKAGKTAPRLILERVGNVFSALFIDTNHHIYLMKDEEKKTKNFQYDFYPKYCEEGCSLLKSFGDCILIDYFDVKKYKNESHYNCGIESCELKICLDEENIL